MAKNMTFASFHKLTGPLARLHANTDMISKLSPENTLTAEPDDLALSLNK